MYHVGNIIVCLKKYNPFSFYHVLQVDYIDHTIRFQVGKGWALDYINSTMFPICVCCVKEGYANKLQLWY